MLLTGTAAAKQLKLDGSDLLDPRPMFAVPHSWSPAPNRRRTRRLGPGFQVDGIQVAHSSTIARHLGIGLGLTPRWKDDLQPLTPAEVVELAVESLLRRQLIVDLPGSGKNLQGDAILRQVLLIRGNQPATGSYSETRFVQTMRSRGFPAMWRQVKIFVGEDGSKRADFLVPFDEKLRRKLRATPDDGVLVEVDGREFHSKNDDFLRDRQRHNHYQLAGFRWLEFPASDIDRNPDRVASQLRELMDRCSGRGWNAAVNSFD